MLLQLTPLTHNLPYSYTDTTLEYVDGSTPATTSTTSTPATPSWPSKTGRS